MKPLIYLIIFTFIVTTNSAQDSCKVENPHGLQFQIGTDFQLTNFNGYTFSYRYLLNEKSGFRFGLSYNLNNSDGTYETSETNTSENKTDGITETDGFHFALSVQYHYVLFNKKNVNFFIGAGPFIRKLKSENISYDNTLGIPLNNMTRHESDEDNYGVIGLVGVEYKFSTDFTISAEIGILGQFTKVEWELIQSYSNEYGSSKSRNYSQSDGFQIQEYPVKMG